MIKSFNQFNESINIDNSISDEEIEDQFLRLKEVFNCRVSIPQAPEKEYYCVCVDVYENDSPTHNEIIREVKQIKKRIEAIYKNLSIFLLEVKGDSERSDWKLRYEFYIYIKGNEKLKKYLETLVNGDPFRLKNLEDL